MTIKEASMMLAKALLDKEPTRKAVADKLGITSSYLTLLLQGNRIASMKLCRRIKTVYPDLLALCLAVQVRKADL